MKFEIIKADLIQEALGGMFDENLFLNGIYKMWFTNHPEYFYVGRAKSTGKFKSSRGFRRRWLKHICDFRNKKHANLFLQRLFDKNGLDNLSQDERKKLEVKTQCGITPEKITELKENEIFVFGSNLAGIHGAGAAKLAKDKFGAKLLVGHGMTGNCYAFPTKDQNIQTIALDIIPSFIYYLQSEVQRNPKKHFLVTKVGCGLAGYNIEEIAPLFKEFIHYENCSLPQEFIDVIKRL